MDCLVYIYNVSLSHTSLQTLTYYEDHNWTEYWGNGDKGGKDAGEVARNKKVDKPQAPTKKEAQKTSRSASPSTSTLHPSPSSSPSVVVKPEAEKVERARPRPTTLTVAEAGNVYCTIL